MNDLLHVVMTGAMEEESDWHFSQNPSSSIGHSNGGHDLARTVLEVLLGVLVL